VISYSKLNNIFEEYSSEVQIILLGDLFFAQIHASLLTPGFKRYSGKSELSENILQ